MAQETLCGKDVPRFNEFALEYLLADVAFIETEIQRLGRPGLDRLFDEVKLVSWVAFRNPASDVSDDQYYQVRRSQRVYGAVHSAALIRCRAACSAIGHSIQASQGGSGGWCHCQGGTPSGGSGVGFKAALRRVTCLSVRSQTATYCRLCCT